MGNDLDVSIDNLPSAPQELIIQACVYGPC